ncbi:putative alanine and glycine rich protein [Mycobacterium lentiflavum]|uniref:Putative alanine and glycine rich protein n=1 Tax=Mycobacterium lentiflavum TaxID=141349 RepID=A0A0E4GV10_MYCLN|nr:hypothetical protein [Mycobacterium lentiflavum]CQD03544.1 putative alanine and glycine rich protein [Mycobacterium lentiflavum]
MTKSQALNVEYEELMTRAAEIEQPLPPIPDSNPPAPCEISFVKDAATQLALNADAMRLYLKTAEREWRALADSLKNAAKAYQEVDEESADAIENNSSKVDVKHMVTAADAEALTPPPRLSEFAYPTYYELRQAAKDIEAGDQGAAFRDFAQEWDAFQRTLQLNTMKRFRPFVSWEGEARDAVESNFDKQRQWVISIVALCDQLAIQANLVVDAHKRATLVTHEHAQDDEHPTTEEVALCDYWYEYYVRNKNDYMVRDCLLWYKNLQSQSEEALARYVKNAQLPLAAVTPQRSPGGRVDASTRDDGSRRTDGNDSGNPLGLDGRRIGGDPQSVADPFGAVSPLSTGMPWVPPLPTDSVANDAVQAGKGSPSTHPVAGLKPASFGGGGGGVPAMPLRPGLGSEGSATPQASAPPGAAGLGRGPAIPPAYAALGGGGGAATPPMSPGGQNKVDKGKRVQSDDESLYTEERPWTEGVIGNRSRKPQSEKAAS